MLNNNNSLIVEQNVSVHFKIKLNCAVYYKM